MIFQAFAGLDLGINKVFAPPIAGCRQHQLLTSVDLAQGFDTSQMERIIRYFRLACCGVATLAQESSGSTGDEDIIGA